MTGFLNLINWQMFMNMLYVYLDIGCTLIATIDISFQRTTVTLYRQKQIFATALREAHCVIYG